MKNIEIWWNSFYGSATPVSYILREEIPDRWLRIHSLPESKRYADTPSEYSLLLARQNEVAKEVLGSQSECVLFSGQIVESPESKNRLLNFSEFASINFELFKTIERYEPQIDPEFGPDFINIWWASIVWEPKKFDDIIKLVANDEVRHILFASLLTGESYAPYDGGADLFCSSIERRNELKQQYRQWLSEHPQGL